MFLIPDQVKRMIAIGDVHGCLPALKELLAKVNPQDGDVFVFLGDMINRGPESVALVDWLLAFRKSHPVVCLRGNHEQMLLDLVDEVSKNFLLNNGMETLGQYHATYGCIPPHHQDFFRSLPLSWEWGDFIFVHAGLRPGISLAEQETEDLLWIREEFLESPYDWGKVVVFGHTPLKEPLLAETRIGLDTGAVYGGRLTGCDVLSRKIWNSPGFPS